MMSNGNMNVDNNKKITAILYNHLNLPKQITTAAGDYIKYTYDATGRKLNQSVYNSSNALQKSTDYDDDFIYENNVLQFINHPEGRIVMTGASPEYQYHLKDHLGSVRMTFTANPGTDLATGTLETVNTTTEQGQFLRYTDAKLVYSAMFDHTNGSSAGVAQRLNGSANEKFGLARSLSVMPGDKIQMEVYAKYVDPVSTNWSAALATLMSQVSSSTSGVVVDGAAYTSSTSTFPAGFAGLQTTSSNGAPKAFLNWLVFDRNYAFISGGYQQITTAAKESGSDIAHERIAPASDLTITQPGYVYIYLSNEETTPVEVYGACPDEGGDDFKVTQVKSMVVQEEDYYPFGLTFNSYQRENATQNKYLFNQGTGDKTFLTERVYDLGLDVDLSKERTYDYVTGRWWQVDPLADHEELVSLTPYNYSFNNPVLYNDPTGDCPQCIWGAIIGAAVDYGTQVAVNLVQGKDLGDALTDVDGTSIAISAGVGALTGGLSALKGASGAVKVADAVADVAKTTDKVADVAKTVDKVADVASVSKNAQKGAQFEKTVITNLEKSGHKNVSQQVTIKAENGVKTRVDFASKDASGKIKLTEAKSSQSAALTKNQKSAFSSIEQKGGTVVGKGKPGFEGGTKIPPTKVDVVRPQ